MIRRISFDSVDCLVETIEASLSRWNEGAKSYVGTRMAEQILEKVVRCLNLFISGILDEVGSPWSFSYSVI